MRFLLLLVLWPAIALAGTVPPIPQLPLPAELSATASGKPALLPTGIAPRSRVSTSTQGSLELHGVTVAEAIGIAYEQFLKSPYVIEPDVMADTRLVSLRWDKDKAGFDPFITRFADELGYSIERKGGISFVKKKGRARHTAILCVSTSPSVCGVHKRTAIPHVQWAIFRQPGCVLPDGQWRAGGKRHPSRNCWRSSRPERGPTGV